MKIYFSASIRGGNQDKEMYVKLIHVLQKCGIVLTEHNPYPTDGDTIDKKLNDADIFNTCRSWIEACDVLVAEVSTPSLGVGYEIAYAIALQKKVICLYRRQAGKRLSAMIGGNENLQIVTYDTVGNLEKELQGLLSAL